ncbi:hypothetical protein KC992_01640 [Candidatus Saccharibacteria bacterium]|nr:hypothetical protein [Candidatus Saccharibacteria bacterium]
MAKKKNSENDLDVTRLSRTLYFLIAVVVLSVVIFDSGNLLTREAVNQRWLVLTLLLGANTTAWFLGGVAELKKPVVYGLSLVLVAFAGFMTYWERGMASTSTILYVLPLLVVATLKNRHALLGMAALSAGTYAFAAVRYFNDFFNEGYRIQLWGNLAQYTGIIFVTTWLIMIIAGLRHDSK